MHVTIGNYNRTNKEAHKKVEQEHYKGYRFKVLGKETFING